MWEGGKTKLLKKKEGNRPPPSVVAMSKSKERLVGQLAKRQAVTNPANTLYSIKRLIGRRFKDKEVKQVTEHMPYKIVADGDRVKVKMGDKDYTPPEISAMVLQKLKADAEEKIGDKITQAVITVPAYFDASPNQAAQNERDNSFSEFFLFSNILGCPPSTIAMQEFVVPKSIPNILLINLICLIIFYLF